MPFKKKTKINLVTNGTSSRSVAAFHRSKNKNLRLINITASSGNVISLSPVLRNNAHSTILVHHQNAKYRLKGEHILDNVQTHSATSHSDNTPTSDVMVTKLRDDCATRY